MSPKKLYGPKNGGTYAKRAEERWDAPVPDWVIELATAADKAKSLGELGERVRMSAEAISAVIGNKYPGKTDTIEGKVRGALMSATVNCPALGEIGRNTCIENQALPFSGANPQRAKVWRACRNKCPNAIASHIAKGGKMGRSK